MHRVSKKSRNGEAAEKYDEIGADKVRKSRAS